MRDLKTNDSEMLSVKLSRSTTRRIGRKKFVSEIIQKIINDRIRINRIAASGENSKNEVYLPNENIC